MTTKMTFRASGIIVPLLTPIHADESVDFEQLDRLIEHVLAGGVNALLIMGSTGEFARFDADTRSQILARAVRKTAGAAPVYAGVGDAGTRAVLRNIRL
ncbi:MAG: dihydrodipicolinate synthase family protein, partial [Planctomycetes bacterium]|nr:dihydrodipicolinate synthase family protein [Planctomycetota bacterium]